MWPLPQPSGELQWFERRSDDIRAWLHPRVGPELSSAWVQQAPELEPSRPGDRSRESCRSADGRWFLKRRPGGPRRMLAALARGLELEEAGLPIPVHLAVLHTRSGPGAPHTTLITEALEALDLDEALRARPPAEQAPLLDALGELVATLHDAGYRQRDLKAPNILVTDAGALALVDLEGVRRSRSPFQHEKDLGRLAASFLALGDAVAEPQRWLASYQAHGECATARNRHLAKRVRRLAERKQTQNARRGRPLR